MQNPDPAAPATPRAAAWLRHDTVGNCTVTSVPSIKIGGFPAIGRHARNRDIDDVLRTRVCTHKSSLIGAA
jgi:hypothetical protein